MRVTKCSSSFIRRMRGVDEIFVEHELEPGEGLGKELYAQYGVWGVYVPPSV